MKASHLRIVPQVDEKDIKLVSFIEQGYKLKFLCRSLDVSFNANFSGYFDRHKHFIISYPPNIDVFSLREKLEKVIDKELCLATIMGDSEVLGISFKILEITSDGILCSFPESSLSLNRRQSVRYKIDSLKHRAFLEIFIARISPNPIKLHVADLSIHGVSCYLPMFLKTGLSKGLVIQRCSLVINNKTYPLTCEIRNMLSTGNNKFPYKIGMRFNGISPFVQIELANFLKKL